MRRTTQPRANLLPVRAVTVFNPVLFRLPDGLTRRGDINLLMLGDPGTAKSQLLKFVERCSPIGVGFVTPALAEPDCTVVSEAGLASCFASM